jgi:hypothetical protein
MLLRNLLEDYAGTLPNTFQLNGPSVTASSHNNEKTFQNYTTFRLNARHYIDQSRGSVVDAATDYGLDDREVPTG